MFIWLKKGAEVLLTTKEKVKTHQNGRKYVETYGGVEYDIVGMPIAPNVPYELVEYVTLVEVIRRGFRTEGVYRYGTATLVVGEVKKGYEGDYCQDFTVGAPTISSVVCIYTKVRRGELAPVENWGNDYVLHPRKPKDSTMVSQNPLSDSSAPQSTKPVV